MHRAERGLGADRVRGAELRYASGLFNLMRNLGGAIGIAVVNTWLQDNARIVRRASAKRWGTPPTLHDTVGGMAQRFATVTPDPAQALLEAQGVNRSYRQQAMTIAFDDVFRVMCWMFVAALLMVPFASAAPAGCPITADSD